MATSSFLRNVNITTAKQAQRLVGALEKAEKQHGEEVKMSRSVHEVKREQAKEFFAKIKWS
ncbi:MAG: hypothetical protein IJQ82_08315 [Selenomonadaceae bacterium]|nr:hypothetical protein [Selenomonadaceae bacterium]